VCDAIAREDGYVPDYEALPLFEGSLTRDGKIAVASHIRRPDKLISTPLVHRLGVLLHELAHGELHFGLGGPREPSDRIHALGWAEEEVVVESTAYLVLHYFGTTFYPSYSCIKNLSSEDPLPTLSACADLISSMSEHFIRRIESCLVHTGRSDMLPVIGLSKTDSSTARQLTLDWNVS
jgi:hypothetical protein